ncbi:unnamed protein product, partial [Notodromas monacha]
MSTYCSRISRGNTFRFHRRNKKIHPSVVLSRRKTSGSRTNKKIHPSVVLSRRKTSGSRTKDFLEAQCSEPRKTLNAVCPAHTFTHLHQKFNEPHIHHNSKRYTREYPGHADHTKEDRMHTLSVAEVLYNKSKTPPPILWSLTQFEKCPSRKNHSEGSNARWNVFVFPERVPKAVPKPKVQQSPKQVVPGVGEVMGFIRVELLAKQDTICLQTCHQSHSVFYVHIAVTRPMDQQQGLVSEQVSTAMDHGSTLKFCLAGQVLKEQVLETSRIHHYFMRTIVKELSLYLHEKKLSGGVDVELERVMRRSKNDENTHLTRLYESSRKQMVRMLQMESQKFCKFLAHALIRITMAKTGSGPDVRASILGAEKNLSPADVDLLSIQQDSSAAVAVLVDSDYGHNTATSPVDDSDFLHRKLSSEGRRRRRYKSGLGSDSNLQVSYTTNRHPPRSDAGSDQEHVSQTFKTTDYSVAQIKSIMQGLTVPSTSGIAEVFNLCFAEPFWFHLKFPDNPEIDIPKEDIVMTTTSVPEGKMRATALRLVNALRSESDLLTGDNAVYRRRTAKVANWISSIGEGKKHRRVEDTAQLPATVRSMRLLKMASKFKDPADDVDSEDSRKRMSEMRQVTYRHNKELERKQALEEAKETASKYHHASDRWRHRSKPRKTRPRRPPRGSQQQGFKAPDDVEPSTDDILNSFTPSGNKSSLDFLVVPAEKVLNPKTGRVRGRNKDADDDNDDDAGSTLGKHYLDDVPAGALKRVLHQVLPPGAASSKTSTSASSVSSSTSSNAWSKTVDKDHGRLATLKPIPMQRAPFCGKKCRVLFLKDVERYQDCLQRCLLGNTRYMKTMMLNILQEIQEANKVTVWNPSKQQPADPLQGPTADMKPRPSTVSIKSLTKKSSRSSSRKRYRSPKRNRVRHVSGQDTTEKDGQEISAEEASQDHPQPEGTKCGDVEGIVKLQESAVKSITEEISKVFYRTTNEV